LKELRVSVGAVRQALSDLADFLDALAQGGPDSELARRAALNISAEIAAIDRIGHTTAVDETLRSIEYAMGSKGIFDWAWSPHTERELLTYTSIINAALQQARRNGR
jgi:hypothetical protein